MVRVVGAWIVLAGATVSLCSAADWGRVAVSDMPKEHTPDEWSSSDTLSPQQAGDEEDRGLSYVEMRPIAGVSPRVKQRRPTAGLYKLLSKGFTIDTANSIAWSKRFGFSIIEPYGRFPRLEIGMNLFPGRGSRFADKYNVAVIGTMAGVSFSFRIPYVRVSYRAKALFHDAALAEQADPLPRFYFLGCNEFVFGKSVHVLGFPLSFVPQFVVGLNNGLELRRRASDGALRGGAVHYHFHYGFGLRTHRRFELGHMSTIDLGVQFLFESAFKYNEDTERRLNLSFTVSD